MLHPVSVDEIIRTGVALAVVSGEYVGRLTSDTVEHPRRSFFTSADKSQWYYYDVDRRSYADYHSSYEPAITNEVLMLEIIGLTDLCQSAIFRARSKSQLSRPLRMDITKIYDLFTPNWMPQQWRLTTTAAGEKLRFRFFFKKFKKPIRSCSSSSR